MRVYQPPLAKQSPSSPPSYTLAAAVVAAYLVLVAIVVAVPIVFDCPLEPSTWVRNTKAGRRELPKPKYGVAELAALVANSNTVFPRVVRSNITKIVHQSYKTRSLRAEDYEYLQSWRANHPRCVCTARRWQSTVQYRLCGTCVCILRVSSCYQFIT
jgi:hypothetical protein